MKQYAMLSLLILSLCAPASRAADAPAKNGELSASDASVLAEKFVAAQGFQDLQPKAVGARLDSGIWFVGFRATVGESIHGIMVMSNGQKLKRVNQNLKLDWLTSKPEAAPAPADKPAAKKPAKKTVNKAKLSKP